MQEIINFMIVDGKKIADKILAEVLEPVLKTNKKIRLAIVEVGEDPVSQKFVEQKKKAAQRIGVDVREYKFPETISTNELRKKIAEIVHIKQNSGAIIQLPLPEPLNIQYILNSVPPEKDVDMLSAKSLGNFVVGKSLIDPPVVGAVKEIFKEYKIDLKNKNIVLVGAGRLVGRPLAIWLLSEGATFSVINENIPDPKPYTLVADILISGVGKPKLIAADMIKEGVIAIDCGTSIEKSEQGAGDKLVGDVDFDSIAPKASLITPAPGGVGPITVAMLFKNLITLMTRP